MLHGHGDDAYQHGDAVRLNFSSNVRPGGARSRVMTPTFSEYEDAARLHRHAVHFAPWSTALQPLPADCELLWVCNPNNPTGAVLAREPLLAWIDAHPGTVFVVDLAYADFCATAPLTAQDATSRANLILVHSLTKIYGLRLGYLVTTPGLRQRLANGLVPWAVNCLALAAGNYCLDHSQALTLPLDAVLADAESLGRALAKIPGVAVHPSTTTFRLFELRSGAGSAAALKTWLIREHGMLERDASNFRGLGPQAVRVATQGPAADAQLVAAVRQPVAKGVLG
jgi:threonine-phosphate decarboxylase